MDILFIQNYFLNDLPCSEFLKLLVGDTAQVFHLTEELLFSYNKRLRTTQLTFE